MKWKYSVFLKGSPNWIVHLPKKFKTKCFVGNVTEFFFFFKKHLAFFSRYVGANYSNAQEAMEETMHYIYSQRYAHHRPSSPVVGQLVVIRAEEGDELARAQVVELMTPNTVKVMVLLVKKLVLSFVFSVQVSC